MRLDKFLSNLKYGTRSEIKKFIKNGNIIVNDCVIKNVNTVIDEVEDTVKIFDEVVFYKDPVILMLNKPKGYVSANRDQLHETVLNLIDEPYSRFDLNIAGRLDVDTEGLIILTNDGRILHDLISPKKDVYKKYYVEVDNPFDSKKLLRPMTILDGASHEYTPLPPRVEELTETSFYLEIKEGKFHQVKRMCQYFGVKVIYLKRVAIGNIELDPTLQLGEYKEIEKSALL